MVSLRAPSKRLSLARTASTASAVSAVLPQVLKINSTRLVPNDGEGCIRQPSSGACSDELSADVRARAVIKDGLDMKHVIENDDADDEEVELAEGEYIIERLLARSIHKGWSETGEQAHQYLVRWAGYGPEDDTWEMEGQLLQDVPEMVDAFRAQPIKYSIIATRQHSAQRQFLVRFLSPDTISPLAEEEWMTRTTLRERGIKDGDARTRAYEADPGKVILDSPAQYLAGSPGKSQRNAPVELRGLGLEDGVKEGTKRKRISVLPATPSRPSKILKSANSTPAKSSPKPLLPKGILVSILDSTKYKRKHASSNYICSVTFRYRPNGPQSPIVEDTQDRGWLCARFGKERVAEAFEEWKKGKEEERNAFAKAQLENEYELERLKRIEENRAMMMELGLAMA